MTSYRKKESEPGVAIFLGKDPGGLTKKVPFDGRAAVENRMPAPPRAKHNDHRTPQSPLHVLPKEMESRDTNRQGHSPVRSSILHEAQEAETMQGPVNGDWISEAWFLCEWQKTDSRQTGAGPQ